MSSPMKSYAEAVSSPPPSTPAPAPASAPKVEAPAPKFKAPNRSAAPRKVYDSFI